MSLERKFHDETQIIKDIFKIDIEIHKKEASLKEIKLSRDKLTTSSFLEEYDKTLLELKQIRDLLQEKFSRFIEENIIKINAQIYEHNNLIKIYEEQEKMKNGLETIFVTRAINFEKNKSNHLKISLVLLEKIQKSIEQNNFYPTEETINPIQRNLAYKEEVLKIKKLSVLEKLELLNVFSYDLYAGVQPNEKIDSAIFILIDVVLLANAELKKDIQDDDMKKALDIEISHGLLHLTAIYLKSENNFKDNKFKESLNTLYSLLCHFHADEHSQKSFPIFQRREDASDLSKFTQFLKNILENKKEEDIMQTTAAFPKEHIIGASIIVGVTALYSLPIAGGLLFGAGLIKVAEKLKDCCEPRKSPKPGKPS